jgi:plasmid stabilization system protein ParE
MQVRWTAPAAQDLEEITLYILKDSESAARQSFVRRCEFT